ncbi:CoA-binding protein [Micromonospora zingiberis]|uniref:CoA-binding protein n=1 Tax=Micromonospora zingiberis TaxID=2053011 RepID=A0A4R0GII3_9ACTN|nr:acetate--CoA ligase family protein [Micromonospora zingiberis]TCB97220.1 CoA-binding protein [Micromonospora zingiberis]
MVTVDYSLRRQVVTPQRVGAFFGARSIAIVGASSSSSWALNLLGSLRLGGGVEHLTFVHPKYSVLFDRPTIPTLRDLAEPVDLAYVMVGPNRVDDILEDAGAAGVKNVVVLAAGYGETGADGRERQQRLGERAVELDLTIMGPNTIGFINAVDGISPWAVASHAPPLVGPVSAVFESGSMARATYEFAQAHGVGSSIWASVGNSVVLTSLDVLEYLIEDESTRAIALFLETVREPDRLFTLGRRALEAGKPIVAYKAGRSEEGMRSAMAHTGAVATDDAIVDAAFRQAGIVRVESIEELVSTAGLLGHSRRLPRGRRMGVVTSSGGGCNIIADLAQNNDLALPAWHDETVTQLREHLPEFASVLNPLDTTGFGHARARPRPTKAEDDLMEIAVTDPGIDFMFSMMTPLPPAPPADPDFIESRMKIIGEIVEAAPVPIFLSSNTCLDVADYPRRLLADNGLYLLPGADLAMSSIGHMMRWVDQRERILSRPALASHQSQAAPASAPTGTWAEDEGRNLLSAVGVPLVPARLVTSAAEAAEAANAWPGPLALKICSRDIAHKSDVGGVVLGIEGPEAAAAAYRDMVATIAARVPEADVRGVLISPLRGPGPELLVGVTVDPIFGPVLALGLGGIWVEVLGDSSLRVLPVDATMVKEMLRELRGAAMLRGARGTDPVDLDALSEVVVGICHAALSVGPALDTLEVNPLRISAAGIEALDVLVTTRPRKENDGE